MIFLKHFVRFFTHLFFKVKSLTVNEIKEIWRNAKVCCVLAASGIGDSLMATPLIEEIKKLKPDIKLIIIASKTTRQVFDTNPKVDMIYSYNPQSFFKFLIMILKLKFEKIDIFFAAQPSNTIKHSLISVFSGAKLKLKHTYDYKGSTERDYSCVYNNLLPDSMERHRVELNLDFLRLLGEDIQEKKSMPKYYTNSNAENRINELLGRVSSSTNDMKIVAMHLGGLRKEKKWGPTNFAEVAQTLISLGYVVCLVGGKEDEEDSNVVKQKLSNDIVVNFTGKLLLAETAALLKKCQFLLSNDTGIMHLATAVGTPVIAIFGPTNYRHIGPYNKNVRVVFKSSNIHDVTVTDVLSIINEEKFLRKDSIYI